MYRILLAAVLTLAALPAWALSLDEFEAKGRAAVALARDRGLADAEKIFADPKNGFLALDGPGLHVWATTAKGVIVFDLSGQTTPGTDINAWANDDGVVLMDFIRNAIASPDGSLIARFKGVPHPKTNKLLDVTFWCGRVRAQAIGCATFWPDAS